LDQVPNLPLRESRSSCIQALSLSTEFKNNEVISLQYANNFEEIFGIHVWMTAPALLRPLVAYHQDRSGARGAGLAHQPRPSRLAMMTFMISFVPA
jgi:hypothetical protein